MIDCVANAAAYVVAGLIADFCVPAPRAGETIPDSYVWELEIGFDGHNRLETIPTPENYVGITGRAGEDLALCVRAIHNGVAGECGHVGVFRFVPNYDTDGDGCVGGADFVDLRRVFGQCISSGGGYQRNPPDPP